MNTLEISQALQGLKCRTLGVFAADRIPVNLEYPAAIVINTDIHTKPGKHWVAFYVNASGYGIYFDSYGLPPYVKVHLKKFRRNCRHYIWNTKQLQGPFSKVCGEYCVTFLYNMCSGKTLEDYCNMFSKSLNRNDEIVSRVFILFVKKKSKNQKSHSRYLNKFPYENSSGYGMQGAISLQKFA